MVNQISKPIDRPDRRDESYQIRTLDEVLATESADRSHLISNHQYRWLWTYAANCILAIWLIASPFVYDYKRQALANSDVACGLIVIVAELVSFSPRAFWLRWATPIVALWLLMAPLLYWSPTPASYLTDTLVACFLIAFSFLLPGTPGRGDVHMDGADIPPGWSYNPSSWIRRWLGICVGCVWFLISRYLAARQLGYMHHAWDPFFGSGSDQVLHSVVSKSFPISDAGFGCVAYVLEVLAGFMGDRARWRTSPYVVLTFGLLVVPLGVTSVVLVMLQPTVVGAWCGLCLVAAAFLLTSVPLAVHELIAMGQFMHAAKTQHKNFWQTFLYGGSIVGGGRPDPDRRPYTVAQRWIASIQGVTVPWTMSIQLAIGIWLMARPTIIPIGSTTTGNIDHLIGAMVVTVAAVATAEVTRTARFLNVVLGLTLVILALAMSRGTGIVFASEIISGLVIALTSLPRGEIIERYSSWDRVIK